MGGDVELIVVGAGRVGEDADAGRVGLGMGWM